MITQIESTEINPVKLDGFAIFLYAVLYLSFMSFYLINTIIISILHILAWEEYQMMFYPVRLTLMLLIKLSIIHRGRVGKRHKLFHPDH